MYGKLFLTIGMLTKSCELLQKVPDNRLRLRKRFQPVLESHRLGLVASQSRKPVMMRLPKFEYHVPQTIAEAVRIMGDTGLVGQFVAGGTDLYPNMKRRQQTP